MQWEAVAAATAEHVQRTGEAAFDVEDLEAPRHNVLVFHGVGGTGKTTLSRKLEAALTSSQDRPAQWTPHAVPDGRRLPVGSTLPAPPTPTSSASSSAHADQPSDQGPVRICFPRARHRDGRVNGD